MRHTHDSVLQASKLPATDKWQQYLHAGFVFVVFTLSNAAVHKSFNPQIMDLHPLLQKYLIFYKLGPL